MSPRGLHGMPALLRFLTTYPEPEEAAFALATGPLAPYDVRTCLLWLVDGDDLVCISSVGNTAEERERYAILPSSLDTDTWRTVRTLTPIHTAGARERPTAFASIDANAWHRLLDRTGAASVLRIPLAVHGEGIGAIGVIVGKPWQGGPAADALLRAIGAAFALWVTHPDAGAAEAVATIRARHAGQSMALTIRQREVLLLVEQGLTNIAIAERLNVSDSSIKQDLQRAMRSLGTSSRDEAAARARALGLL